MAPDELVPLQLNGDENLVVGALSGPSITFAADALILKGDTQDRAVPYSSILAFTLSISKNLARHRNRIIDRGLNVLLVGGFNLARYNGEYLNCAIDARGVQCDLTLGRLPQGEPPRWFGAALTAYFEFLETGHHLALISSDPSAVLADLMGCRSRSRWRASVKAEKFAKKRLQVAEGK